jgi:signal transduction histidine kinase
MKMKVFHRIASILDHFLSHELQKMESHALIRVRFLVFALLFVMPCGFIPSLLLQSWDPSGPIWIYQGFVNLLVALLLLKALRRSRTHLRIAFCAVLWLHILFLFTLLALPSLFSLVYLWISSLVVISSLIFGMRGALLSSSALTTISLATIAYRFQEGIPWVTLDFEAYVHQIFYQLAGSTLLTAAVTGVHEFMRDASESLQSRQRLIAARHAHTGAVGELVGHVAHEVNNPLAIMQGSVIRLRRQLERGEWSHEAHKLLLNMQRSHERMIRVQQSLAIFASGHQHEPFVSHELRSLLKDVQRAMKPQAQAQQVRLEFKDLSQPQPIRCQPHQLVYVLCSMIQNALDACRDHAEPHVLVEARDEGSMLVLTVSDNGKGIDPSVQDRIFQPFFTTKTGGQAQGLSLSVSRGILARHGGEIRFQSQPGATRFSCMIPRMDASDIQLARGA